MAMAARLRRLWVKANDPKVEEVVGMWCSCGLGVAGILWGWYAFEYAPSHRLAVSSNVTSGTSQPSEIAVRTALLESFGVESPTIIFLKGDNLDIYLRKSEFQRVLFPDRLAAVEHVGSVWCDTVDLRFVPAVRIRDLQTGRTLDSYSCLAHRWRKKWRE